MICCQSTRQNHSQANLFGLIDCQSKSYFKLGSCYGGERNVWTCGTQVAQTNLSIEFVLENELTLF